MDFQVKYPTGLRIDDLKKVGQVLRTNTAVEYTCHVDAFEKCCRLVTNAYHQCTPEQYRLDLSFTTEPHPGKLRLQWVTVQQQHVILNNKQASAFLNPTF